MAPVSITVTAEPHDLASELQKVLQQFASSNKLITSGSNVLALGWTTDDLDHLWQDISKNSRDILAEIAKKPEGYPWAEVAATLNLTTKEMAGQLSNYGTKRQSMGKSDFIIRDNPNRRYKLPADIAAYLRKLAEGDGH